MKVFWIAIAIFVIICIFIGVHHSLMANLSRDVTPHIKNVSSYIASDRWNSIQSEVKKIAELWNKYKLWATLTISTKDIEQIELSLKRCLIFAQIKQKADFLGEFTNLEYMMNYLPQREGFHLREIL